MEEQGCGYALKVWTGEIQEVLEQLHRNQIPMRRVYVQEPEGKLREIAP